MIISWANARAAEDQSVQLGFMRGQYNRTVAAGRAAYSQADLCGPPATTVGWRDTGAHFHAALADLPPGAQARPCDCPCVHGAVYAPRSVRGGAPRPCASEPVWMKSGALPVRERGGRLERRRGLHRNGPQRGARHDGGVRGHGRAPLRRFSPALGLAAVAQHNGCAAGAARRWRGRRGVARAPLRGRELRGRLRVAVGALHEPDRAGGAACAVDGGGGQP